MSELGAEGKTDIYRVYESVWRNMDREHNLISQRITWCILFSAGLFSASTVLATILIALGRSGVGGVELTALLAENLHLVRAAIAAMMALLAAAGARFSYETRRSVVAAREQIDHLRKHFEQADRREKFRRLDLPRPFGEKIDDQDRGRAVAKSLPNLLAWIWSILFICDLLMAVLFILSPRLT